MKTSELVLFIVILLVLIATSFWIVKGMIKPEGGSVSFSNENLQKAKAAENPSDPCATPAGYTDDEWREHMSHHPDQYAQCLGAETKKTSLDLTGGEKLSFNEAVGKKAPDFSLENLDGQTIKLSDNKGKNVILFFNEGTMCYPACWSQITEFGKDERFNTNDIVAFSVVVDQKSAWEKITRETPGFSEAKILFDPTRAVSSAYDVLSLKSSMHPGSYPGHTYFIIDKEGIVRYVYDDPNMAIRNDLLISEISKFGG